MKERYLSKTPFLTFVYLSKCNINLPNFQKKKVFFEPVYWTMDILYNLMPWVVIRLICWSRTSDNSKYCVHINNLELKVCGNHIYSILNNYYFWWSRWYWDCSTQGNCVAGKSLKTRGSRTLAATSGAWLTNTLSSGGANEPPPLLCLPTSCWWRTPSLSIASSCSLTRHSEHIE